MSRSMSDNDRRFCVLDCCLRSNTTWPEYRNFTFVDIDSFSVIRFHNIGNTDFFRITHMYRSTVNIWHFESNIIGFLSVFRCHRAHGANHRTGEWSDRNCLDICLKHRHISSLSNVADLNSFSDQCFFERERTADQKSYISLFPVFRSISDFFGKYAVFINSIFRNVSADISAFSHIMGLRSTFDDFKNWAWEWILVCKFFKICCIFGRQDYQICLCITTAHTGCRKINNSLTDEFADILWGHIYIRCDVKSHNKLPPVSYFTI